MAELNSCSSELHLPPRQAQKDHSQGRCPVSAVPADPKLLRQMGWTRLLRKAELLAIKQMCLAPGELSLDQLGQTYNYSSKGAPVYLDKLLEGCPRASKLEGLWG